MLTKLEMTLLCLMLGLVMTLGCKQEAKSEAEGGESTTNARTPVTIDTLEKGNIADLVELNATAAFRTKSFVNAYSTGYITEMRVQPGDYVEAGGTICIIKTKESQSLGSALSKLDTSLNIKGAIIVKSKIAGYVSQLKHQTGDYVQDGEALAVINDANSFVFMMELPYELKPYLPQNHTLMLELPDGNSIAGNIESVMPSVESLSQTQSVVIKTTINGLIPEGLIAKVKLTKNQHQDVWVVDKESVVANETQSDFWIMRLADTATAVKVNIKKGFESNGKVEIFSDALKSGDLIVRTGNYGLGDTAKVSIVK